MNGKRLPHFVVWLNDERPSGWSSTILHVEPSLDWLVAWLVERLELLPRRLPPLLAACARLTDEEDWITYDLVRRDDRWRFLTIDRCHCDCDARDGACHRPGWTEASGRLLWDESELFPG